ncbi:putative E3 ubiquitin-protein ligase makorin-1 [Takifugu flavidus]|uniref:RING-type E3 ubiquitin transferase n=1 Tax=Takifugu flavidus TaxID=433684 RepID=A0A5C6ND45_9TELE|nr:putative E3 ubiquitin-protein ligase makorin-1 [Takifugu flavidus]
MAEAAVASTVTLPVTGGWTKHVTCRYFMHGLCKEGDNCRYSHDLTSSKPAAMMCKFFQKGNCVFGERCRFEHCKPTKSEEVSNPQMLLLSSTPPSIDPECSESGPRLKTQDWANAAEFVPGQPYCGRAESVDVEISIPLIEELNGDATTDKEELRKQLCPYAAVGECRYGVNCAYLHGDVCDMCGLQVLHPTDSSQRSEHTKACIEAHEKDMEISFAIQRSKDMMCGVCMEVVFEKVNPSERRFGILSNCSHCYCLKCIRKWRSAKQFESKIIKSCPECRITSNFVIPSEYWVEDKEDKQKLIQKYKDGMGLTGVPLHLGERLVFQVDDSAGLGSSSGAHRAPYPLLSGGTYFRGLQLQLGPVNNWSSGGRSTIGEQGMRRVWISMSEQTVLPDDAHVRNAADEGLMGSNKTGREQIQLLPPPHPHLDSMEIPFPSWGTRPEPLTADFWLALIAKHLNRVQSTGWRKPCRYFDEGRGICPFGANCFYKHAFPDGRLEEAQPQRRQTGSSSRNRVTLSFYIQVLLTLTGQESF